MRQSIFALAIVLAGALACGAPPLKSGSDPTATDVMPQPAASPSGVITPSVAPSMEVAPVVPPRSEWVGERLEEVSAARLMADVEALSAIPSRHVNSAGVAEAAATIHRGFESAGGRLEVTDETFPFSFNGVTTQQTNVIATLPGRDPAAGVILLAAHYDSRTVDLNDAGSPAPGANDNASGVAALLEMARIVSGKTFEAGLVFACFSAEEINAGGSHYHLAQAQTSGEPIAAVIVLDIVGNSAGEAGEGTIRVFSAPPDDSPARGLARTLAYQAEVYLPGFEVQVEPTIDRPGRYSDHMPFSEADIPAIRLIEAIETPEWQHSALDLPEHVSPDYLRRATQLALATAIGLADGPAQPSTPILAPGPERRLEWEPVEGAVGYVIGLRGVESAGYDIYIQVKEAHLPLARIEDTGAVWAVGVAAVDEDGLVGRFSGEVFLDYLTEP